MVDEPNPRSCEPSLTHLRVHLFPCVLSYFHLLDLLRRIMTCISFLCACILVFIVIAPCISQPIFVSSAPMPIMHQHLFTQPILIKKRKIQGPNTLKNHIKNLRIEAAKAAALCVNGQSPICIHLFCINNHSLSSLPTSHLPPTLWPLCQQSATRLYTSLLY
jgi:hypothetical protein